MTRINAFGDLGQDEVRAEIYLNLEVLAQGSGSAKVRLSEVLRKALLGVGVDPSLSTPDDEILLFALRKSVGALAKDTTTSETLPSPLVPGSQVAPPRAEEVGVPRNDQAHDATSSAIPWKELFAGRDAARARPREVLPVGPFALPLREESGPLMVLTDRLPHDEGPTLTLLGFQGVVPAQVSPHLSTTLGVQIRNIQRCMKEIFFMLYVRNLDLATGERGLTRMLDQLINDLARGSDAKDHLDDWGVTYSEKMIAASKGLPESLARQHDLVPFELQPRTGSQSCTLVLRGNRYGGGESVEEQARLDKELSHTLECQLLQPVTIWRTDDPLSTEALIDLLYGPDPQSLVHPGATEDKVSEAHDPQI